MGIGVAVAGLGTALWTAGATAIVSNVVIGAIVGAAIGGISAAISGGNILEGVLFGAVGGAVLGAVSGMFATGTSAISGGAMGTTGSTGAVVTSSQTAGLAAAEASLTGGNVGGGIVANAATTAASDASWMGTAWSKLGEAAQEGLVSGIADFAIEGFKAGGLQDQADAEMALKREQMAIEKELAYASLQNAKDVATIQSSGGSSGGSEAAENYTREVAQINADAAMDVARQNSADLAAQLQAAKQERKAGYLREDQSRDRQRDTASGVLISRQRTDRDKAEDTGEGDQPVDFVETPDTPIYVE